MKSGKAVEVFEKITLDSPWLKFFCLTLSCKDHPLLILKDIKGVHAYRHIPMIAENGLIDVNIFTENRKISEKCINALTNQGFHVQNTVREATKDSPPFIGDFPTIFELLEIDPPRLEILSKILIGDEDTIRKEYSDTNFLETFFGSEKFRKILPILSKLLSSQELWDFLKNH